MAEICSSQKRVLEQSEAPGMAPETKMIRIEDVVIKGRHRKDMGDIEDLANSIDTLGLLQPIGVTQDLRLVFGERRLKACREYLGWTMIPAHIIDVEGILYAENDENEKRKNFTVTERVAIADALRKEFGKRQGQRSDLPAFAGKLRGETDDHVAKGADFGSADTLRRAERIVKKGIPQLREAVDRDEISISRAAQIAALPSDEQLEAMKKPREQRRTVDNPPVDEPPEDEPPNGMPKRKKPKEQEAFKPQPATVAMKYAVMALTTLQCMRPDDPGRDAALQRVIDWCQNEIQKKG